MILAVTAWFWYVDTAKTPGTFANTISNSIDDIANKAEHLTNSTEAVKSNGESLQYKKSDDATEKLQQK